MNTYGHMAPLLPYYIIQMKYVTPCFKGRKCFSLPTDLTAQSVSKVKKEINRKLCMLIGTVSLFNTGIQVTFEIFLYLVIPFMGNILY